MATGNEVLMHPETTRGRVVALTIAVALAVTAAPAAGDIHDTWLAQAHDIAMWRWPTVCQPINYDDVHRPVPGPYAGVARRGGDPCTVYLDSSWRSWDYWYLCTIVVHEVGHLAGRGHVGDTRSVMYEYASHWPPCRNHKPPNRPPPTRL